MCSLGSWRKNYREQTSSHDLGANNNDARVSHLEEAHHQLEVICRCDVALHKIEIRSINEQLSEELPHNTQVSGRGR